MSDPVSQQPPKKGLPTWGYLVIVALALPLVLAFFLALLAAAGVVFALLVKGEEKVSQPVSVQAEPAVDLDYAAPPPPRPMEEEEEEEITALLEKKDDLDEDWLEGLPTGGILSSEKIKKVIKKHLNEIKYCYEKSLVVSPKLSGKVRVKFVIGTNGKVEKAKIENSSLADPDVEECILKAVKRWRFPPPEGGVVVVNYPFVFQPGSN